MPQDATADLHTALAQLSTTTVGREIQLIPAIDSTNRLLSEAARDGAAEGLVAIADEQLAGRGRRGRSWASPPGSSVLCSVLLRPTWLRPEDAFALTLLGAVAASEALGAVCGLEVGLKWPNDLLAGERKLGGLLVEVEASGRDLCWAVIGCGINVSWDPTSIPELRERATSVSLALGREVQRGPIARALLERLDHHYRELRRSGTGELWQRWRALLTTIGKPVRVERLDGPLDGWAIDVDPDGALLVRDDVGIVHRVLAGEVSLRQ